MGLESGLSVLLEIESATRAGQPVMLKPESQRSKINQKNLINSQRGPFRDSQCGCDKMTFKDVGDVVTRREMETDASATRAVSCVDQCKREETDPEMFLMH